MAKKVMFLALAVALCLVVIMPASAASPTASLKEQAAPGAIARVYIVDNAFVPAVTRIHPSDRVVWINVGARPHTTTSINGLWDSGPLATREWYTRVFTETGTYGYICTIHPMMRGAIIVAP